MPSVSDQAGREGTKAWKAVQSAGPLKSEGREAEGVAPPALPSGGLTARQPLPTHQEPLRALPWTWVPPSCQRSLALPWPPWISCSLVTCTYVQSRREVVTGMSDLTQGSHAAPAAASEDAAPCPRGSVCAGGPAPLLATLHGGERTHK